MEESDYHDEEQEQKDWERLKPWQWKKGQSGNPKGRPPGKSAKQRAKEYLATMTDEEFENFLAGMDKRTVWEMAEGKPKQDMELSGEVVSKVIKLDE